MYYFTNYFIKKKFLQTMDDCDFEDLGKLDKYLRYLKKKNNNKIFKMFSHKN